MAKGAWIGVDSKARKIKKMWIGVDGKARKVKKVWIGVGGKAMLCWSGGELSKYGTATSLSSKKNGWIGTSNPSYALFLCTHSTAEINAYNASLTKTSPHNFYAGQEGATATVGNYALYAGGMTGATQYGPTTSNDMYAWDNSLTYQNRSIHSSYLLAGASVGSYAIFAGGKDASSQFSYARAFNTSLTESNVSALSQARSYLGGAKVGSYALFAGGYTSSSNKCAVVDTYNTSLTKGTAASLSVSRHYVKGVKTGNHALFVGGGENTSTIFSTVDAYDASLTRTIPTSMSVARYTSYQPTDVGEYAVIAGGYGTACTDVVDVYDASLTRTLPTKLSSAKRYLGGATVGNYALFAGGATSMSSSTYTDTVDVYQVG